MADIFAEGTHILNEYRSFMQNMNQALSAKDSILELQRKYTELWKQLPEEAKAGRASPTIQELLDQTLKRCKSAYSSLLDLYHPCSPEVAMIDPASGNRASHRDLAAAIGKFHLPLQHEAGSRKPVVAISLPNGALLATTVLATATYYTAAPVAHGSGVGKDQFKSDVLQSRSNLVLAAAADVDRLGLRDAWLAEAKISVLLVELSDSMDLIVRDLDGMEIKRPVDRPIPNTADDTGIMLFTSGTSGTKKLVPLTIHSLVCGVAMVEKSWGLSPSMRCLNQMPLNHVGGLVRNLFAPVFSGGSVICCSAFDANLFWDCVEDYAPTWYYASPSMHQVILEAGAARPESVKKSQIRLICNAAGGLLPSLAIQLRETFSSKSVECTVLPSYGMTECMPISTPPLNYRLEKTGTSGVSVGPEIAILDGRDQPQTALGEVGRIAVRGSPVFGGYLKDNNVIDKSCFTPDGWFDTGDMGYLDSEGYLYITGRSKEVINRGGELISPFEVEEAIVAAASKPGSPIFGRVSKALAFSVTHDVLQEVVGLAVVTPAGAQRACLRSIQEAVKSVLSQVKVPVVLVFMDGGVPTNNNKVLRIKLTDRLGLPEIADHTPPSGRYFEAACPPPNTPLSTPINCSSLRVSHEALKLACAATFPANIDFLVKPTDFHPELIVAPTREVEIKVSIKQLEDSLYSELHGYDMPTKISKLDEPFPRNNRDEIDEIALAKKLNSQNASSVSSDLSPTEATISKVFAQVLSVPPGDVDGSSDFFELGGDSMGAGRLLNALRKEYPIRLPINVLFTNSKVSLLAQLIDEKLPRDPSGQDNDKPIIQEPPFLPGCEKTCSSTNPIVMLLQLLPLAVFYPMRRALTWTIFMYMLQETTHWGTFNSIPGRLVDLVISITVGGICTRIVSPWLAIAFKWLVIGRYKEGLYPMWGSYHTRWWLVQKTVAICGMGVFGMTNWTRACYLRLLGVKIGKNVSIQKGATFGEWDLITIEDDAVLERCIVRPFAAERNTSMYLGRIRIGKNASIGLSSIVAAGTEVPPDACIGPNSSSWEIKDSADESNRDLAASKIPGAHWALNFFLGFPTKVLVKFIGMIPWLAVLVALVRQSPVHNDDTLVEVITWFATPARVGWHYFALAANVALGPAFLYVAVLIFKKIFDVLGGSKIGPSSVEQRSQMTNFRMEWLRSVMPAPQFHNLTELFGTHYEATSVLARALGAKVGKQVYWPGTGPSVQDWDLLNIGDNVVFGSRSHIVTSDGLGSDYVKVGANAMVADRVVLLPGVELGEKTVMGSGALTRRDKTYAPETTWVGSKGGEALCLSADTSSGSSTATGHGRISREYNEKRASQFENMVSANSTDTTLANFISKPTSYNNTRVNSERSSLEIDKRSDTKSRDSSNYDLEKSKKPHVSEINRPSSSSTEEPQESSSPFGRAFYEGKATYRVWGQFTIFFYSTLITVVNGVFWNVPSVSAIQVVSHLYQHQNYLVSGFLSRSWWRPLSMYIFFTALILGMMALQAILVIGLMIAAKWVVIGKRKPGNYDWDKYVSFHFPSLSLPAFY